MGRFCSSQGTQKTTAETFQKEEIFAATWTRIKHCFPEFLELRDKTPDELIEEAMIDSEIGEMRIDEYFFI